MVLWGAWRDVDGAGWRGGEVKGRVAGEVERLGEGWFVQIGL